MGWCLFSALSILSRLSVRFSSLGLQLRPRPLLVFCPFFCVCECSAGPPPCSVSRFLPCLLGCTKPTVGPVHWAHCIHQRQASCSCQPCAPVGLLPPALPDRTHSRHPRALVSCRASCVTHPGLSPPRDGLHLLRQALGAFLEQEASLKFKAWVSITRGERSDQKPIQPVLRCTSMLGPGLRKTGSFYQSLSRVGPTPGGAQLSCGVDALRTKAPTLDSCCQTAAWRLLAGFQTL